MQPLVTSHRIPKVRWIVTVICIISLFTWVMIDLYAPRKHNIRSFDPYEVARLDTEMWHSYYDRKRLRLFNQFAELIRTQFQASFLRSYVMAYQAAGAAFIFKDGHNRNDYQKALPYLIDLYASVHQMSSEPFDVERVAHLELEWWIVHRERNTYTQADLEMALAQTASAIYHTLVGAMKEHAYLRAQAMYIRDTKAVQGGVTEEDWKKINSLLISSCNRCGKQ